MFAYASKKEIPAYKEKFHRQYPLMSSNDKYQGEGDSQVRDIIQKINEERPGQESSRETIVRKDGSKAVRIVRKKRVLISEKDKSRKSRRVFLMGVFGALVALACFLLYFVWNLYRLSSTQAYEALAEELRVAWGAEYVTVSGVTVTGFDVDIDSIAIGFPQQGASMVQSVQISKVRTSLQKEGVISGDYIFEEVQAGSIDIVLRADTETMKMGTADINRLLDVRRVDCPDFSIRVGSDPAQSTLAISGSELYLRYTDEKKTTCSITIDGGKMNVRGWKEFTLNDARLLITDKGIDELRVELKLPDLLAAAPSELGQVENSVSPTLYLSGDIAVGSSIYGPYGMDSRDMPLADFTEARLISFLTAQTRPNRAEGINIMSSQVYFSNDGQAPSFRGQFLLKDVKWKNLPAQQTIMRHLPADRRPQYVTLGVSLAKLNLESNPETIHMSFKGNEMAENYGVTLVGDISLDSSQALSGKLNYGLPSALTRAEYPDGISDPVFVEQGELAWLNTVLSGTAFAPRDNALEQDNAAAEARKSRPAPFSLDDIDFKRVNEDFQRLQQLESGEGQSAPAAQPAPAPAGAGGSSTLF